MLFKRPMFSHPSLYSSLTAHLSDTNHAIVHHDWLTMITNSLPHVLSQAGTADLIQCIIGKICDIFDKVSKEEKTPYTR